MSRAARLIPAKEAAAYLSLPVKALERLGIGRICLGTKVLYDRVAIDRHLDALTGAPSPSPAPADNDDAEAAFERSCPNIRHAARKS